MTHLVSCFEDHTELQGKIRTSRDALKALEKRRQLHY